MYDVKNNVIFLQEGGLNNLKDEQKLLINIKKKKRGSLEDIIDLYTPYVSVIVYNVIGSVMTKEDIEEVVSDVFISLWNHSENLDNNKGCIRTYIGATARNLAKNKLRKAIVCDELNGSIPASDSEPDKLFEAKEEQEIFINLIRELGEPDSEIFIRYYYYEEKISQISKITCVCISTVKTKLARGRKHLKKILLQKKEVQ